MKDGMIQLDLGAVTQPRTLFKPVSWLAKIDFINHLILFNNVLITVLSEKKGGKTCFNTLLQNNLDQQVKSIALTVKPPCDRLSIINDIATRLHLNNDEHTDIASIVTQVNERKAHVLLIIDDAQNLPESFIKEAMLTIKHQDNFNFFHLCLISDYSVVATLNQLAVEQFTNLIHTIEIGPLNESETRTYVLQRSMAERLITKPLTDEQFKQFYQQTKGNLAKINNNLEAFILKCATQKAKKKKVTIKNASAVFSAAVVAGLSYMYFNGMEHGSQSTSPFTAAIEADLEPALSQKVNTPVQEELISEIASWQDSSTRQLVQFALPKKQVLDDIDGEQNNLNVAIVDKVLVIPTVKPRIEPELKTAVTEPVPESKLVAVNVIKPLKSIKVNVAKTNSKKFTIQLAASHKKIDVNRFKQSNKLLAHTTIRHVKNAKGTWYILTMGEYDSRGQAQLHAKKLPSELAKLKPWIRPVSGLDHIG